MSTQRRHIKHLIERLNKLTGQSQEWDAPGHFSLEGSRGNRRIARNTVAMRQGPSDCGQGLKMWQEVVVQGGSCGVLMTEKETYKALKLACEVLESLGHR